MGRADAPDASAYSYYSEAIRDGVKGDCSEGSLQMGLRVVYSRALIFALIIILSIYGETLVTESKAEPAAEFTKSVTGRGGALVIMEQATATWCETCASHEQWLPNFDAVNHARVQRVALHPVQDDPLGNAATSLRLLQNGAAEKGYVPLYHFDGTAEQLTSQNAGQMQSSLLTSESDRARFEVMQVRANSSLNNIELMVEIESPITIANTSITVMIINKMTFLAPELAENGVTEHPFLLDSLFVIPLNGSQSTMISNSNISATVESMNSSSEIKLNLMINSSDGDENRIILVIHEYSESNQTTPRTLSALRIEFGDNASNNDISSLPWLAVLVLGVAISMFTRNRRHRRHS